MTLSGIHRALMRTSMLATMVAAVGFAGPLPARAADDVTADRLLNADKEPSNWLHHHKNTRRPGFPVSRTSTRTT